MIRRAAAVVLVLAFNPALLCAQDTVLTVTVPSADVYKGPTTVAPVIGRAARGTVLPVARNLGSWAKVAWPDAPDGVGYVHLTI
jgi:SH3 domain-containing protein